LAHSATKRAAFALETLVLASSTGRLVVIKRLDEKPLSSTYETITDGINISLPSTLRSFHQALGGVHIQSPFSEVLLRRSCWFEILCSLNSGHLEEDETNQQSKTVKWMVHSQKGTARMVGSVSNIHIMQGGRPIP